MKTEGGFVNWKVISAKSCASPIPIPASGLEIPLLLKFSRNRKRLLKLYMIITLLEKLPTIV